MAKIQVLLIVTILCLSYVVGHSYVTKPTSRSNQKQTTTGCRGPNCLGPCDVSKDKAKTKATTIARGATINVQWPRNNHAGGFIRFAWAPTSGSDIHANFDNGVQEIHCHEIGGCKPDSASDPNGGDSGPADGSRNPCQTTITVPSYLTDGTWTLQWAWFGGAFELGDYYSCVDYVISGGTVGAKLDPVFYGGDYTYPGQNKCKFFNTDRLHQCVNEPCNNPVYKLSQERSGPAYMVNSSVQPTPATTKANRPVTTKASSPVTTKAQAPVTTKSNAPATQVTTGSKTSESKSVTTSKVSQTSLTTGSGSSTSSGTISNSLVNCAGLKQVVPSSAAVLEITHVDTWSNVFRLSIEMHIQQDISNWMLQVIWPSDAVDTEVQEVFNAGHLKCSATQPTRHSMIAPVAAWAQKVKAGELVIIELRVQNTNMNKDFILKNTKLVLFKQ